MQTDPSDPARFRRLEEAFHRAQTLPEAERSAWAAEAFPGDPAMRSRLERMLATSGSEPSTRSLGLDAVESAQRDALGGDRHAERPSGQLAGQRLGAYHLLEFRGEGGFGEVYLAEQREPIRRRVAVKVLRAERSAGESLDRFRGEVASLARLEHPGIARIYDAGEARPVAVDGGPGSEATSSFQAPVPFIAMEFVDGTPITLDAARRGTSPLERIALVADVADAMQHAHQRGIIHRDIKPSNVLVTLSERGAQAKIIDFGIAKAIGSAAAESGTERRPDAERRGEAAPITGLLGTPRYMSPEQADRERRQEVDTRTDIYSLGLILGELMAAPASGRALARAQREDLERVRLKAANADRERRYPSAAAFADDLRRVARGEAVSAGPATLGYRLSRLLSRHRVTSAAIALAALALLGGTVAATLGLVTARSQAARADSVKAFLADLLTMVNPERRGADVPLSSVLDEASERVAERFAGQPLVEGETRILLGEAYTSLWRVDAAVREYRTAVERFTANAGPEHPETLRARIRLSQGLLGMGKPRDAATASEGLGDLVGRVFGARSREAAQIEIMTARIAASLARPEEAEQRITAAAAWIEVEFADDTDLLLSLMAERVRVARRVAYHYGLDSPKAMGAFEKAYALSQQLVAFVSERGIPDSTPTFVALGEHTRTAIDIGRYSEALAAADRLLALVEGKLSECHDTRLDALRQRGEALRNMGYGELAVECMLEAMECQRTVVKPGSMAIVSQEIDLLPYLDYTGRFEEVDRQCRAIFVMVERFGPMGEQLAREVKIYEARALSRLGRTDEAEAIFRQLLASADLNAEGRVAARLRAFWAAHLARTGRAEEARAAIAESHRALPATVTGTWQHHVDDRLAVVLETYELLGDTEAAAEARRVQEELFRHNRAEP